MNTLLHKVILIVDDMPLNLVILGQVLQTAGATVHTAASGKEALELLETNPVDIILTDLQMPEMDGWEMTNCIRQSSKWYQHLPIIATTAETEEAEMQKCFALGMDEIIHKPIDPATVYQKIEKILSGANKQHIPVTTHTNEEVAFDLSYLKEVTNGDNESLLLFVDNLKENAPLLLSQATDLVSKNKWEDVAAHLHKLKGLTALFGMHTTTKDLREAEQEAKEKNPSAEQVLNKIDLISNQLTDSTHKISYLTQLH
jgi:CheY-like chemotaxis protein/HPt (histidine-containing phosphotransfer) domain-containing protein